MSVSSSQLNDFMGTIHLFSVERRLGLYGLNSYSKLKKKEIRRKVEERVLDSRRNIISVQPSVN